MIYRRLLAQTVFLVVHLLFWDGYALLRLLLFNFGCILTMCIERLVLVAVESMTLQLGMRLLLARGITSFFYCRLPRIHELGSFIHFLVLLLAKLLFHSSKAEELILVVA